MADEAFALSPISAHAASPTEADYDAISEAFMETARGRWFLGEFAKRNRNADTAMVLEAVTRIEHTIASQKSNTPPDVSEAIEAVKTIIGEARANAAAVTGAALEEIVAPYRKSARIIREIAWGLRESGADVRICDLLDTQVSAINASCETHAAFVMRDAMLAAFDLAIHQIDELCLDDPAEPVEESEPAQEPAIATEVEATATANAFVVTEDVAVAEPLIEVAAELIVEDGAQTVATLDANSLDAISDQILDTTLSAETTLPALEAVTEPEPIAIIEAVQVVEVVQVEVVQAPVPEPVSVAAPQMSPQMMSLGESLIASGIAPKANTLRFDPLAVIRAMSPSERIAFFS